jgi:hypothetical protein
MRLKPGKHLLGERLGAIQRRAVDGTFKQKFVIGAGVSACCAQALSA